ncbi:MAG: T9SS type A sorting domain-containing protein [Salinivirgaceae bacterium]|nr:T9SS type A sorting domain-containing protein [Salinivirgaceae bacterium]
MKIKHYILGAAAMLMAAGSQAQDSVAAVDSNFYIFLCFGQSNMEGQGTITAADRNVDERFQAMNTTDCDAANGNALYSWRKAVPPLARCGVGLGPVDYFGRLLLDSITPHNPNIRIGVVDVAVAGCGIELFSMVDDSDLKYKETAADWMQGMIAAYGGRPYQRLVDAAREAQKSGVIKGILLHQGESNNGSQAWPGQVAAIYDSLISQLNLNPDDVPLLVGETVTTEVGGACGWHNTVVALMPNVVKNAYVVSAKNLAGKSDGLHFTDKSYRVLGKRYAKQWLRSAGYEIAELPDSVFEKDVTACDKYNWYGKDYKRSTKLTKTDVLENDQNFTNVINLTILKSTEYEMEPVTVEKEYTWPVDGKTYTKSQTLTYELENAVGCDSIIYCELTVGATALGEDAANEQVAIYPNPATDVLNISVPACAAGLGRIAIYTSAGVEVVSTDFVSELESFDVSNWSNGVYMVWITDVEGNVWTGKFVKTSK